MKSRKQGKLTPLESLIMNCIWDQHPITVRDVQTALKQAKPMAYNTVLTMMRILRDKGFLTSQRQGRSDLYSPTVPRQEVAQHTLRDLIDRFFAGSASALVSQVLDSGDLDEEDIRSIRSQVNRRLRDQA